MTVVAQDISTLAGARTLPFLAAVEERLAAQLADDLVGRASRETLAAGGKRLRPLLVLIAAPPDARERPELEIAACAAELVHMATLVHDDVLDAAPLRRGHATVWARHGEALARATGDHLFALAFAGLTRAGSPDAVALLARAALDLARGEALQSEQARRPEITVEAYLERCLFKTGRLFARRLRARRHVRRPRPRAASMRSSASASSSASRSSSPTTCSTATAIPRRPARRSASTCSTAPSRCRSCWPPSATSTSPRRCSTASARRPTSSACSRASPRRGAIADTRRAVLEHAEARARRRSPRCPTAVIAGRSRLSCRQRPPATTESSMASTLTRTLIDPVREKVMAGERLDFDDGVALLESDDLLGLGELADQARRLRGGGDEVYFVNNLYLNHTNVCRVKCKFCAFARTNKQDGAYTWEIGPLTQHAVKHYEHEAVQRDPHGRRREPLPRPRLLPRSRAQPQERAAGRDAEVLHGLRGAPHDEALGADARRGAQGAVRGRRRDAARAAAPRSSPTACARSSRPARSTRRSGSRCTASRTGWASRRTARCSTTTSRPTRSASTTCCACATCRTRRAASWPSSRSRSTPRTPSSSGAAGRSRAATTTSRCRPSRA